MTSIILNAMCFGENLLVLPRLGSFNKKFAKCISPYLMEKQFYEKNFSNFIMSLMPKTDIYAREITNCNPYTDYELMFMIKSSIQYMRPTILQNVSFSSYTSFNNSCLRKIKLNDYDISDNIICIKNIPDVTFTLENNDCEQLFFLQDWFKNIDLTISSNNYIHKLDYIFKKVTYCDSLSICINDITDWNHETIDLSFTLNDVGINVCDVQTPYKIVNSLVFRNNLSWLFLNFSSDMNNIRRLDDDYLCPNINYDITYLCINYNGDSDIHLKINDSFENKNINIMFDTGGNTKPLLIIHNAENRFFKISHFSLYDVDFTGKSGIVVVRKD